jgi:hypothetical protein
MNTLNNLYHKLDNSLQELENIVWKEEIQHLIQIQKNKVNQLRIKIKEIEINQKKNRIP